MGYKNVCLNCKTAFSTGMDYEGIRSSNCTKCKEAMILVSHKFKPPQKSDVAGWKIVKLLLDKGFRFGSVYTPLDKNILLKVTYPTTLEETKEFVKLYEPSPNAALLDNYEALKQGKFK